MGETYKLTYFNIMGLAEPIRLIFAYAGVPYEDERIDKADWPELKSKAPWGNMPILTINGNKTLCQSTTIARYLGKKYNLMPSDPFLAAKCDEYEDAFRDFRNEGKKYFGETDEAKKAELKKSFFEQWIPKYFGKFDKAIEENGYIVCKEITWLDIYFAQFVSYLSAMQIIPPEFFASYPNILKLKDRVFAIPSIEKYVQSRPKTER